MGFRPHTASYKPHTASYEELPPRLEPDLCYNLLTKARVGF